MQVFRFVRDFNPPPRLLRRKQKPIVAALYGLRYLQPSRSIFQNSWNGRIPQQTVHGIGDYGPGAKYKTLSCQIRRSDIATTML